MASRCCNPSWKMQAAISVVNPVLKHVEIHPSLTGEGGVRQDSFSNLFWSADLHCKLSAFEESWAVRCAEMPEGTHRTHLNCETSHVQDKREKKMKQGCLFRVEYYKQLRIPGMSWSNETFQALHKMPQNVSHTFQTRISNKIHRFTVHAYRRVRPKLLPSIAKSCFKDLVCK